MAREILRWRAGEQVPEHEWTEFNGSDHSGGRKGSGDCSSMVQLQKLVDGALTGGQMEENGKSTYSVIMTEVAEAAKNFGHIMQQAARKFAAEEEEEEEKSEENE